MPALAMQKTTIFLMKKSWYIQKLFTITANSLRFATLGSNFP